MFQDSPESVLPNNNTARSSLPFFAFIIVAVTMWKTLATIWNLILNYILIPGSPVQTQIITFYNARRAREKKFHVMNHDFGRKHLPCSFMNENTAFLLMTAMAANFYQYLISKIAKVLKELDPQRNWRKKQAYIT